MMPLTLTTVMLTAEQHEWVKSQPAGLSGTLRILVDEAMKSQRKRPSKADLETTLRDLRQQQLDTEARLRDEVNARLEAQQRAERAEAAAQTDAQREAEAHKRWDAYRDAHPEELRGLSLAQLVALKERVTAPPPSPPSQEGGGVSDHGGTGNAGTDRASG